MGWRGAGWEGVSFAAGAGFNYRRRDAWYSAAWYCVTTLHTTVEPWWIQGGLAAISVATRRLPRRCSPECEADPQSGAQMSLAGDSRVVGCQHDTCCQLAVATITATGVPAKLRARDTDLICAAELGERECASGLAWRGLGGGLLRGRGRFQLPPARRVVQRWYGVTTLHATVEPRWVRGGGSQ